MNSMKPLPNLIDTLEPHAEHKVSIEVYVDIDGKTHAVTLECNDCDTILIDSNVHPILIN